MSVTLKRTDTITAALDILRFEYLEQLAALAVDLRRGFETGLYGAEAEPDAGATESPYVRLFDVIYERLGKDVSMARAIACASPNFAIVFDSSARPETWIQAANDAITADLLMLAEANGWTRWKAKVAFGSHGPLRAVKLPRRAA